MIIDYLIVGQGIAGTLVANALLEKNKSILVIDNHYESSASIIAAGLYNPVVFKRFVKSWMVDELLPFADETYTGLEKKLNETFYHKRNIYKVFASNEDGELWADKSENNKYMSSEKVKQYLPECIANSFGGGEVINAGNLDVAMFLRLYRKFLISNNLIKEEAFDYNELEISDKEIVWKGIRTKKIIFCEGYKTINNPFFKWLPFKLTKGEMITVKIENFNTEKIINKGVFILPLGENLFKVGATYEWNDLTEKATEKGESELTKKLKSILNIPFEIIDHLSGIRPTVSDRRPLIGLHPEHKNLVVFNGMGTKGVLLAPYFANQLACFLENNMELHPEANIERYYKKYKKP